MVIAVCVFLMSAFTVLGYALYALYQVDGWHGVIFLLAILGFFGGLIVIGVSDVEKRATPSSYQH